LRVRKNGVRAEPFVVLTSISAPPLTAKRYLGDELKKLKKDSDDGVLSRKLRDEVDEDADEGDESDE